MLWEIALVTIAPLFAGLIGTCLGSAIQAQKTKTQFKCKTIDFVISGGLTCFIIFLDYSEFVNILTNYLPLLAFLASTFPSTIIEYMRKKVDDTLSKSDK